jgi:hypothetical protein
MHDCALRVSLKRSRLPILLSASLLAAGCSTDVVEPEKRPPATKHLKYIEELQKKGAPTKNSRDTGR